MIGVKYVFMQRGDGVWPAVGGSIPILAPDNGNDIARSAVAKRSASKKASGGGWRSQIIAITGAAQFMWKGCGNGGRRIRNTGSDDF